MITKKPWSQGISITYSRRSEPLSPTHLQEQAKRHGYNNHPTDEGEVRADGVPDAVPIHLPQPLSDVWAGRRDGDGADHAHDSGGKAHARSLPVGTDRGGRGQRAKGDQNDDVADIPGAIHWCFSLSPTRCVVESTQCCDCQTLYTRETRLPQAGTLRIVMDMSTDHRQPG